MSLSNRLNRFVSGGGLGHSKLFRFGLVGGKGSGKTSILTALACAREAPRCDATLVRPNPSDAAELRDGYKRIAECRDALSDLRPPESTQLDRFALVYEMQFRRDHSFRFQIDDYGGELLHAGSSTSAMYTQLNKIFTEVDGLIIVAEYPRAGEERRLAGAFNNLGEAFLKIAGERKESGAEFATPVAFLVNKWDRSGRLGHDEVFATPTANLLGRFSEDLEPHLYAWTAECEEFIWTGAKPAFEQEAAQFSHLLEFLVSERGSCHKRLLEKLAATTTGNCRPFPVSAFGPSEPAGPRQKERPKAMPLRSFGLEAPFLWLLDRVIESRIAALHYDLGYRVDRPATAEARYQRDTPDRVARRRAASIFNIAKLSRARADFVSLEAKLPENARRSAKTTATRYLLRKRAAAQAICYAAIAGLVAGSIDFAVDYSRHEGALAALRSPSSTAADRQAAVAELHELAESSAIENIGFRLLSRSASTVSAELVQLMGEQETVLRQKIEASSGIQAAVDAIIDYLGAGLPLSEEHAALPREFADLWNVGRWDKAGLALVATPSNPWSRSLTSVTQKDFLRHAKSVVAEASAEKLAALAARLGHCMERQAELAPVFSSGQDFVAELAAIKEVLGVVEGYGKVKAELASSSSPSFITLKEMAAGLLAGNGSKDLAAARRAGLEDLIALCDAYMTPQRVRVRLTGMDLTSLGVEAVGSFGEGDPELRFDAALAGVAKNVQQATFDIASGSVFEFSHVVPGEEVALEFSAIDDDEFSDDSMGSGTWRGRLADLSGGFVTIQLADGPRVLANVSAKIELLLNNSWIAPTELVLPP